MKLPMHQYHVFGVVEILERAKSCGWSQSAPVAFLGGGKIMGCLELIGDVDFTGTLDAKMEEPARIVKDMAKEWRGNNEKAHAREEVTRWGGCYGLNEDE